MCVGGKLESSSWIISLIDLFGLYSIGQNISVRDERLYGRETYGGMLDGTVYLYGRDHVSLPRVSADPGCPVLIEVFEVNYGGDEYGMPRIMTVAVEEESCLYLMNYWASHMTKLFLGPGYEMSSVGPFQKEYWRQFSVLYFGSNIYVVGGIFQEELTNRVWLIDITTGDVSEGPPMVHCRSQCMSCVMLYRGKPHMIVVGGYGAEDQDGVSEILDSVELLDLEPAEGSSAQWFLGKFNSAIILGISS